ncbi:MAG TPA: hypothetical protein VI968_03965 [archaeon]|nr:hypothetical protein [archaeon]
MKGQIRIISEVLLFMVGIAIASFVIYVFGNISSSVQVISTGDQMKAVGNEVADAIIKASKNANTTIRVEVPMRLSGSPYSIWVLDHVVVSDGKTTVYAELFNITKSYDIIVLSGKISSAAQFVEIQSTGDKKIYVYRT